MQADTRTLVELVAIAGLIGGTLEFAHILRRRRAARRDAALRAESADAGLRGLARVLLVDREQDDESPDTKDGRPG